MPEPQITLAGTLQDIFGDALEGAALVFQLCGYGYELPRVSGTSLLAQTAPDRVETDEFGAFSKKLYANDAITPAGTFYTVQVQDTNGNVVQTAAYQFNGAGTKDLSDQTPYDPGALPPPPPPPPAPVIIGNLVVVPYSAAPDFNGALGNAFEIVLTGDATPAISGVRPGQLITFFVVQDGTGGRAFEWPANVINASEIDATAGAISVQSFVGRSDGNLYPIGPMTVN